MSVLDDAIDAVGPVVPAVDALAEKYSTGASSVCSLTFCQKALTSESESEDSASIFMAISSFGFALAFVLGLGLGVAAGD